MTHTKKVTVPNTEFDGKKNDTERWRVGSG